MGHQIQALKSGWSLKIYCSLGVGEYKICFTYKGLAMLPSSVRNTEIALQWYYKYISHSLNKLVNQFCTCTGFIPGC